MPFPAELLPTYAAVTGIIRDPNAKDLTLRQLTILMMVANKASNSFLSVREVHELLGLNKPSITRNCNVLESYGMLTRKTSSLDRRKVNFAITQTGRSYLFRMAKHLTLSVPQTAFAA